MTVGIAYRALLRDERALAELVAYATSRATAVGWLAAEATPVRTHGARVRQLDGLVGEPQDLDLAGLWINPHFAADDLCLVFDRTGGALVDPSRSATDPDGSAVFPGFAVTRTTYADASTHVALIQMLEELANRDLASVEMGDPAGRQLARDVSTVEKQLHEARVAALRETLERPEAPIRLGGAVELLAPAETRRRQARSIAPLELLTDAERGMLERSREHLIHSWGEQVRGLDGPPEVAVRALESLTDILLSHPEYRHQPEYLEQTFAWESGVVLGFALIEALGGHWEREDTADGPRLRVAHLGDVGLVWRPLASAAQRLHQGPILAHDTVLGWLQGLTRAAREVFAL